MADIRRMPLGQVVDYVISYNERQERSEKEHTKTETVRMATQADINAFCG